MKALVGEDNAMVFCLLEKADLKDKDQSLFAIKIRHLTSIKKLAVSYLPINYP